VACSRRSSRRDLPGLLGVEASATAAPASTCSAARRTSQHLFGTDGNFRDVFSRVVYGARTSLAIGFAAIGFAIIVGTTIGSLAGYIGGWMDNVLMRLMDIVLAFPSLLLAIAIVPPRSSLVNAKIGTCRCRLCPRRACVRAATKKRLRDRLASAGESREDPHPADHTQLAPLIAGTLGIGGYAGSPLAFVGCGDFSPGKVSISASSGTSCSTRRTSSWLRAWRSP
jgi:hypothetical protein